MVQQLLRIIRIESLYFGIEIMVYTLRYFYDNVFDKKTNQNCIWILY